MTAIMLEQVPLRAHIVYHPRSEFARTLALGLFRWLHSSSIDLNRAGLGIPVQYGPVADDGGPIALPLQFAARNFVVLIIDAAFVADYRWRAFASRIVGEVIHGDLLVTSVHPSASRIAGLGQLQAVTYLSELDETRAQQVLRRRVTETICRRLRNRETNDAGSKVRLFISHAKADGRHIALALRNVVLGYGQLDAFFDESQLAYGHTWQPTLEAAASADDAMVVVLSDQYAGRPWCRLEIQLARRPRRVARGTNVWLTRPVLVVDCLQRQLTRGIPELGNTWMVKWRDEDVELVVDHLLLELLLSSYYLRYAQSLPVSATRQYITWAPDVVTVSGLLSSIRRRTLELVYPGQPLGPGELSGLQEAFPRVRFRTFDEATHP